MLVEWTRSVLEATRVQVVGRESQRLIVPTKRGNAALANPAEGRGSPREGDSPGERPWDSVPYKVSPYTGEE